MKCPHCKEKIFRVIVQSKAYQEGTLKRKQIVSYYNLHLDEPQILSCPKCYANLKGRVKE